MLDLMASRSTVADRLEDLAKEHGSARKFGQAAGFTSKTQMANLIAKLKKDPNAVEVATLAKIASGVGVSLQWLEHGTGPKEATDSRVVNEPHVERDSDPDELRREGMSARTAAVVQLAAKRPDLFTWEDIGRAQRIAESEADFDRESPDLEAYAWSILQATRGQRIDGKPTDTESILKRALRSTIAERQAPQDTAAAVWKEAADVAARRDGVEPGHGAAKMAEMTARANKRSE